MKLNKTTVISGILAVLGIIVLLVGILYGRFPAPKKLNPNKINENNAGSTYQFKANSSAIQVSFDKKKALYLVDFTQNDGKTIIVGISMDSYMKNRFLKSIDESTYLIGIVQESTGLVDKKLHKGLMEYYQQVAKATHSELSEEQIKKIDEEISPYYIELIDTNSYRVDILKIGLSLLGLILIIAALLHVLHKNLGVSGAKIAVCVVVFIISLGLVSASFLFLKVQTYTSIRKVQDGFYTMHSYYDLKSDELLKANIKTPDDLADWISANELFGIPLSVTEKNCKGVSFSYYDYGWTVGMGRNYGINETDSILIYSTPPNAYKSIGMTDLGILGIGGKTGIDPDSYKARISMLAAPYLCVEGINEAGVGVSLLSIKAPEIHQANGNPDLYIGCAIRCILDNCDSVYGAIRLLSTFDIQSDNDCSYHLMITDTSGDSAVIEWFGGSVFIIDRRICTNSVITPNEYYDSTPDYAFKGIENNLYYTVVTPNIAMNILQDVSTGFPAKGEGTEWSSYYNLNKFEAYVALDKDYQTVYVFKEESFDK